MNVIQKNDFESARDHQAQDLKLQIAKAVEGIKHIVTSENEAGILHTAEGLVYFRRWLFESGNAEKYTEWELKKRQELES